MFFFTPTGGLGTSCALPSGGLGAGIAQAGGGGGGGFRSKAGGGIGGGFHLGPVLSFDPVDRTIEAEGGIVWAGAAEVEFAFGRDEAEAAWLLDLEGFRSPRMKGSS